MTKQQKQHLKDTYFNNREKRDRPYCCADCGTEIKDTKDIYFIFDSIAYGLCKECFKNS